MNFLSLILGDDNLEDQHEPIPMKLVNSDPTAGVVHCQGTHILHLAMAITMLHVDYGTPVENQICEEMRLEHVYVMDLMRWVHILCFCMLAISFIF